MNPYALGAHGRRKPLPPSPLKYQSLASESTDVHNPNHKIPYSTIHQKRGAVAYSNSGRIPQPSNDSNSKRATHTHVKPSEPDYLANHTSNSSEPTQARWEFATFANNDNKSPFTKSRPAVIQQHEPRSKHEKPFHDSAHEAACKRVMSDPAYLKEHSPMSILFAIGDVITALVPLAFIVLGALAAMLHGHPTPNNQFGENIVQAMKLGPTIFPLVFSAICGRFMKSIARLFAERGAKLGMLELLLASQTVWGTFESQVLLRNLSFLGIHLLLLWSLSPLGSQASFRILGVGYEYDSSTTPLLYMPTGGISPEQTLVEAFVTGDPAWPLAAANALYNSLLLSDKSSTQDAWGNVKIPWIPESSKSFEFSSEWTTMPNDNVTNSDRFTSLAGVPVAGLRGNGTEDFNLDYGFLELECPTMWNVSKTDDWWRQQLGQVWGKDGVMQGHGPFVNTPFFLDTNTPFGERFNDFYVDFAPQDSNEPLQKRNILFGNQYSYVNNMTSEAVLLRNCTVEMRYVEAEVQCEGTKCRVNRMRKAPKYKRRDPVITPFDLLNIAGKMFPALPRATGDIHIGGTTATEFYVRGSERPQSSDYPLRPSLSSIATPYAGAYNSLPCMDEISNKEFAKRLGVILNTYYMLSLAPYAYVAKLPDSTDSPAWGPFGNGSAADCAACMVGPFFGQNATATVTTKYQVYECNFLWLALLMSAAGILLIMGVLGSVLKCFCYGPDMLGYVSSMTYDNKFVVLPPGGTLDGMERSRLLKNLRVRVGDVWSHEEVGHVAFASVEKVVTKLRRDRLYV